MTRPFISTHAVDRWRERVDPQGSFLEARLALGRFISHSRARATPRHWMREDVKPTPGLLFLYSVDCPGVCVLVRDGAVLTVITRALTSSPTGRRHLRLVRPMPSLRDPVPRWRWKGDLGEAA